MKESGTTEREAAEPSRAANTALAINPRHFIPDAASVWSDEREMPRAHTRLSPPEGRGEGHPMFLSHCHYLTGGER